MMENSVPMSRRDLFLFFPTLAVRAGTSKRLTSHIWRYEDMAARENGPNRSRAFFEGTTHTGFALEMHETELAPGLAPHGPHRHQHDELVIVREGILEILIGQTRTQVGAGSVIYINSNEEHGLLNAGATRAWYWILALGRETSG